MLTKDVSAELESAMQKIHMSGKKPTVALVKAHMATSVPMPAIIAAIKSWKGSNSVPKIEVADNSEVTIHDRIKQLEKQVAELTLRLSTLEANK